MFSTIIKSLKSWLPSNYWKRLFVIHGSMILLGLIAIPIGLYFKSEAVVIMGSLWSISFLVAGICVVLIDAE